MLAGRNDFVRSKLLYWWDSPEGKRVDLAGKSSGRSQQSPPNLIENFADKLSTIGQTVFEFGQSEARFRELIEALPAAIYTTDVAGRITFYNEAAAAMWGRRPTLGDDQWCGSWKLYWPDGQTLPHDECPMAVTLKTGEAVRGVEAVAERPDGTRVPFAPYPTPIFDASGKLLGAVNMLVDLSDRQRSEENAQRLASIVQSSDDAIISKDLNGIITSWNNGAQRLFGYTADEVIGKPVVILIPSDRENEEPDILARLRRGDRIDHYETVRRRKDGSLVDISLSVSPIYSADGRVVAASKIARDITERTRAQEQQRILLAEIMHRVKNTLATVQSIATQTLKRTPVDERDALTARLHALSKAHDLLTSDKWDRAPLRAVVETALLPFQQQCFTLEGPDTLLNASKCLQLTLAIHELATNAAKYGALSNAGGRIRLLWQMADGVLKFHWKELGGPPVKKPKHKGFGTILIEHTFEGTSFEYLPDGFACRFEMAT
jgi:PAS domain S-box-containing protein